MTGASWDRAMKYWEPDCPAKEIISPLFFIAASEITDITGEYAQIMCWGLQDKYLKNISAAPLGGGEKTFLVMFRKSIKDIPFCRLMVHVHIGSRKIKWGYWFFTVHSVLRFWSCYRGFYILPTYRWICFGFSAEETAVREETSLSSVSKLLLGLREKQTTCPVK